jgi:hypothetical protein
VIWWLISFVGTSAIQHFCFRGRNAVWGGATLGALIGVVIAFFRDSFDWGVVGHAIVIGAVVGLAAEGLGWIADRLRGLSNT